MFEVSKMTTKIFDMFEVSKMTTKNFDMFKVSKMTIKFLSCSKSEKELGPEAAISRSSDLRSNHLRSRVLKK